MITNIRSTIGSLLLGLACFALYPRDTAAQSDSAVFAHGAASTGSTWNYISGLFSTWFPGLHTAAPSLNQQTDLYAQGAQLAGYMSSGGTTILLGHSNGGLVSRRASSSKSARGIVTVGTPHTGAPIALYLDDIRDRIGWITFALADVLLLQTYDAWKNPTPQQLIMATEQAAYVGAGIAVAAWTTSDNYLDLYDAFDQDDVPGSAFLASLPTGGSDRYSASVSLSTAHAAAGPWILAFSPQDAMGLSLGLSAWGGTLYDYAYELSEYIDGGFPDALFAELAIGSALYLAWEFQNLAGTWCGYVNGGTCFFHDGFIPTSRQVYPGGVNTDIVNGPAHTYQTESAVVAEFLRASVNDII